MLTITFHPACGADDILETIEMLADDTGFDYEKVEFNKFTISSIDEEADVYGIATDWLEDEGFDLNELGLEVLKKN